MRFRVNETLEGGGKIAINGLRKSGQGERVVSVQRVCSVTFLRQWGGLY